MNLNKYLKKKYKEVSLFCISFLLYFLTLSKGFNEFDVPVYVAETLKFIKDFDFSHFLKTEFTRNSLYMAFTLPMFFVSAITNISIEFLLNVFNIIPSIIAVIFVYKTAKLFLKKTDAFLAALIFIFIPYLWFYAIVANTYSLQICMITIWFYFLISGYKEKNEKRIYLSTVFIMLSVLSHVASSLLLFVQAYWILRYKKNIRWVLNHVIISLPSLLILVYFIFSPAYPMSYSIKIFIFMFGLTVWEFINGLSLPLSMILLISLFHVYKLKKTSEEMNILFTTFILSALVYIPSLVIPHYAPIENFNALSPFLPIFIVLFISKFKPKIKVIVVTVLIFFMIIKFLPVVYDFHFFYHPHELYAKFAAEKLSKDSIIIVGHEYAFYKLYSDLDARINPDEIRPFEMNKSIYVTSQYSYNENKKEFEELEKAFFSNLIKSEYSEYSTIIFRDRPIDKDKLVLKYSYTEKEKIRNMEDTYQFLYSMYGNPFIKIFIPYTFPYLPYEIYELRS